MKMRSAFINGVMVFTTLLVAAGCGKREISFSRDVMPVLRANCVECHGGSGEGLAKSGLDLTSYDHLMKGTKFGPVVVRGDSTSSNLYRVVSHRVDPKIQMPPHHDESLATGRKIALEVEQITNIRLWIDQGALNN